MGRKGKRAKTLVRQVAAAGGRKSGGLFCSKKEPEPEPEPEEAEDAFECNPVWFDGAEAGPDDDDSAYTCLCCGRVDCTCVWSQHDNEAVFAALDEHCAQRFTEDTDWSLQDFVEFTGRGAQQQEAAANEHRKREAGWKREERKRGKKAAGAKAASSSKTLDQFGFTKTAPAPLGTARRAALLVCACRCMLPARPPSRTAPGR